MSEDDHITLAKLLEKDEEILARLPAPKYGSGFLALNSSVYFFRNYRPGCLHKLITPGRIRLSWLIAFTRPHQSKILSASN